MAGPVIQLRATNFDKINQEKMLKLLSQIAIIDEKRDNYFDFRFKKGKTLGLKLTENSCPFLIDISTKKEDWDDLQKADFESKIKDNPVAFLSVSAMCKSENDHQLLAIFILELHKIFGGFIDFNGKISPPLKHNEKGKLEEPTHEEVATYVKRIKGKIEEINYEIETGGRRNFYHICDSQWLLNWTQHVDFHLIK